MGLFGHSENKETEEKTIVAPQSGRAVPLTELPDPVFAGKVLGDGVGIIPDGGAVVAPVSGTVVQVAETRHALAIESDDGLEVLVHLGIDTVKLNGQGFTCLIREGQHVSAGEKLVEMDLGFIREKGFSIASPCIVTNMDAVKELHVITGPVTAGDTVIMTYRK